jgi:hypothetical protein
MAETEDECLGAKVDVENAKSELERRRTRLFEVYISKITTSYQDQSSQYKEHIITGLENIVREIADITEPFDPKIAIEIRTGKGLSQSELIRILMLPKHAASYISRYESGKSIPDQHPIKKIPKAYLNWLKEQGYNPYKL